MATLTLRALSIDDIAALQAIDADAHGEAWSHATFVDQIEVPARRHVVALDECGEIIGHAATWLDGFVLRITNVATAASAQGAGVATRLLLHLLDDLGVATSVSLEVRPSNRRAQRLYGRFGFAPVGIDRSFYDRSDATGSRDALVMRVDDPNDPAWRERLRALDPRTDQGAVA